MEAMKSGTMPTIIEQNCCGEVIKAPPLGRGTAVLFAVLTATCAPEHFH